VKIDWENDLFHKKLYEGSKGMHVEHIPETDDFRVRSRSNPANYYKVETENGEPKYCSCTGFSYRNVCAHCVAVEVQLRQGGGGDKE
jgi:hypothetical protein